jgi:hypothetical protein
VSPAYPYILALTTRPSILERRSFRLEYPRCRVEGIDDVDAVPGPHADLVFAAGNEKDASGITRSDDVNLLVSPKKEKPLPVLLGCQVNDNSPSAGFSNDMNSRKSGDKLGLISWCKGKDLIGGCREL